MGRPPQDSQEPDWASVATELKCKGVTLVLLWQEYRAAHPDGYGYTWFCEQFRAFENRTSPSFRNRHEAGAVMQTDYAGHTMPTTDPATGAVHQAQIFVAVLGASSYIFAWASLTQTLPDWTEAQVRALKFFRGVPKAIVCDNLKAAVVKPLWFEPAITKTFADMATHYDTTVLPTRPRKPRDKGKVEGAVLIVERWVAPEARLDLDAHLWCDDPAAHLWCDDPAAHLWCDDPAAQHALLLGRSDQHRHCRIAGHAERPPDAADWPVTAGVIRRHRTPRPARASP
jgi:transposase